MFDASLVLCCGLFCLLCCLALLPGINSLFTLLPAGRGVSDDSDEDAHVVRSSRSHHKNRSIRVDDSEPKLPQPNFDDSEESEKAQGATGQHIPPPVAGPSEPPSDSETCSLFEYVPQSRTK
jgi:hypothetical protein